MFKRRKESQSLINASRKSLAEAESRVEELTFDCKELREIRKELVHNNTILVSKNSELTKALKEIEELATSNNYGNEKVILDKIREAIRRQTK